MNVREVGRKVNQDKQSLEVLVQAPRISEPVQFSFPKTMKVADVVAQLKADSRLKLSPNGTYVLTSGGAEAQVLDPERPLVSYGIKDGDTRTTRPFRLKSTWSTCAARGGTFLPHSRKAVTRYSTKTTSSASSSTVAPISSMVAHITTGQLLIGKGQ
jgi:hypothetical protein